MSPDLPFAEAPSLARVRRGSLCAGCGGCAAIAPAAIKMQVEKPGFLRPVQTGPVSDTDNRLIAEICPGLGQTVEPEGRKDSVLWGPYVSVETGWASDSATRHAGSSGGALTALLVHLVASGEVDAVVTTTASAEWPAANSAVVAVSPEQIIAAAGSRYAPSSPLADLPRYVASGRRFAFVGKPCDIVALRALCRRDVAVARTFPVLLSFFCAGVPSHAGGRGVMAAMGADPDDVLAFRYRGNGWPGRATAELRDGSTVSMSYHDSWGGILSKHVQHRCKICADGTGVAADIVCADAWESDENGYPLFEERDGVSLLMARTELGARIVADARQAARIATTPFDMAGLAAIQPGQRDRRRALAARLAALRTVARPVPNYRGLRIAEAARQNSLRRNLKNFFGMLRRALQGRI